MRLLLVEDEKDLGALTAANLARSGFPADVVETVDEAETAVRVAKYDAILLDLALPDGDGLTFLKGLRARGESVPVLIVTARDAVEDRVAGLESGADDYILKPFAVPELMARVKALLRRPHALLSAQIASGNVTLDIERHQADVAGRPLALTRREVLLLAILMRNEDRVVTRIMLEDELYGFDQSVESNALEVAVHRLRRHLEAAGATVRVHTVRGLGYLLQDAAE